MFEARDLPDNQRLTTDVCVVGAGAAGIAVALEFIGTGIDVLLLESGGLKASKDAQALNAGTVVDPRLHDAPDVHRRRQFGGCVPDNDGRCSPLTVTDLSARSYVPRSGWPITAETLAPYYARALKLVESDESARTYERDSEAARQPLIEGYDERSFTTDGIDHFRQPRDIGARFESALRNASNVCTLLHATVTRLQMNPSGTAIEAAIVRTGGGKTITVRANHFVLAAGTLENARLLLANRDLHHNGIGNDYDNVGRYYLCPLSGNVGTLQLNVPPAAIWSVPALNRPAAAGRRRLLLKPERQQTMRIGNFVARLQASDAARRLPSFLSRNFWSRNQSNIYTLEFDAEQLPNPSSRITLSDQRDPFGMPRLSVDWNRSTTDFETIRHAVDAFANDIHRSCVGSFSYNTDDLIASATSVGPQGAYGVGTTRMGDDPRTSVVDSNCRVHGVTNLFVTGGSVFPTSGLGDPVLTLVALSQRLSDHLKMLEFKVNLPLRTTPALARSADESIVGDGRNVTRIDRGISRGQQGSLR